VQVANGEGQGSWGAGGAREQGKEKVRNCKLEMASQRRNLTRIEGI
jgi:hypothetical protein